MKGAGVCAWVGGLIREVKVRAGGRGVAWRGRVNYTQVANDNCRDPLIPFSIILCGQEPDIGEWSMWGWGGQVYFLLPKNADFWKNEFNYAD